MAFRRRALVLFLILLPLSALAAPAGAADGIRVVTSREADLPSRPQEVDPRLVPQEVDLGWGCDEYKSSFDSGRIAITGRGAFYTLGRLTDGCGGKGCDDELEGELYVPSRDEWLPFGIHEVKASNGCFLDCFVQTRSGTLRGIRGSLQFNNQDEVTYSCADADGWLFSGRQSPPDRDLYLPAVELPFAEW
jgi:hypothetical protein